MEEARKLQRGKIKGGEIKGGEIKGGKKTLQNEGSSESCSSLCWREEVMVSCERSKKKKKDNEINPRKEGKKCEKKTLQNEGSSESCSSLCWMRRSHVFI